MKQEQDAGDLGTTSATPRKPVTAKKAEKNLYEPYVTPPLLYHALRWIVIFFFSVTTRVSIRGYDNIPTSGPFILASNHLSWTDIPLLVYHLPRKMIYMAKEEYFSSRLAWLVRFLGAFPVKRGEADRQALRTGETQLKKGNMLGIFPEGTRSRTHTLAKGHAGLGMIALRTGVPVVPAAIWGSEHALRKFRAPVTIVYGEPIVLKPKGSKVTREDIDEATELVMRKIASMLPPEYRGVYGTETGEYKASPLDTNVSDGPQGVAEGSHKASPLDTNGRE